MEINDKMIKRINELAKLKKTIGLNKEELEEQKDLRQKYLNSIKANMRATLEKVEVVDQLVVEEYEYEYVKSLLEDDELIKDITQEEKKTIITYLCKEITGKEILKKLKTNDKN